ncbi:MAG: hypothetical protein M3253_06815 [Chloroflexota bacterium]|nr:hypothetical protein [Chloroflexota bacterium]
MSRLYYALPSITSASLGDEIPRDKLSPAAKYRAAVLDVAWANDEDYSMFWSCSLPHP